MIEQICKEIDNSLSNKVREPKLFELIVEVMKDEKDLPKKFVEMCYDIHEADSFAGEDEKVAKENNLRSPEWFFEELQNIKERNIEFWSKN